MLYTLNIYYYLNYQTSNKTIMTLFLLRIRDIIFFIFQNFKRTEGFWVLKRCGPCVELMC